ncbi:MAG: glutathione S-transferase family protein [Gammaproteobacteria bacterium]|nr:glutathione S-transferase family protein [Gammaproteobacteria bacterium]NNF60174.1 glutathione S-transferase family protein [Gammaproteobacteria bacterium]NNM21587.1 glutathione S-transferase family protein [Gammaproteobacteria bacterium]
MTDATLVIGNANYSSWSLRAWLACRAAGLQPELIRLPLDTPEFAEKIGELSPTRQVPVLRHEGLVVWDTLAICEYLAERYPHARLWPEAQRLRTLARSACAEMHSGFAWLRQTLPMNVRARGRHVELDESVVADIQRISDLWEQCRDAAGPQARRGPWLFGELTIADCFYIPVASRFITYAIGLVGFASTYVATVAADPLMQEWADMAAAETETIAAEEVGL